MLAAYQHEREAVEFAIRGEGHDGLQDSSTRVGRYPGRDSLAKPLSVLRPGSRENRHQVDPARAHYLCKS
jgi:hypothetical protein